ncbi:MAG: hypothetical protein WDM89_09035 [Rhizomicrobium sp.]
MAISLKSVSSESGNPALKPVRSLETEIAHAARFVRQHVIASIYRATSGHPGGSLSCADLLAVLYGVEMNVWPHAVDDPARDRFVLSKGHAAPALYAIGAYHGFCGKQESLALRKIGSRFQGHPHIGDLPWVETSTGSLGQGFSVALGMAMGLKLQKNSARVYALLETANCRKAKSGKARCAQRTTSSIISAPS